MKPYFKLGYGYKDFMKLFFQINDYEVVPNNNEEENQRKRTWCERNLIIKDPSKSKLYFFWEILFLVAFLIEIVLVPYTSCSKNIEQILEEDTKTLEQIIDGIWIVNIVLSFLTPIEQELAYTDTFKEIACNYLKPGFVFDLLSTLTLLFDY